MSAVSVRRVRIDSLVLPGDHQQRLASRRVAELAKSIDEHGMLDLPIVEQGTGRVLAGGDRVAAAVVLGWESLEVRSIPQVPDEFAWRRAYIASNLHRRNDGRDELLRAYVQIEQERLAQDDPQPDNVFATQSVISPQVGEKIGEGIVPQVGEKITRGRGRPKSPLTVAIEKAAPALGVTPKALQRAEERARAKEKPAAPEKVSGLSDEAKLVRDAIQRVASLLSQAKGTLASLIMDCPSMDERFAVRLLAESIEDCRRNAKAMEPAAACPYCKGWVEFCPTCRGSAWVTKAEMRDVPRELVKR